MALCKQDPRYQNNRGYVFQATVIPGDDLVKRYPPNWASLPNLVLSAEFGYINFALLNPVDAPSTQENGKKKRPR